MRQNKKIILILTILFIIITIIIAINVNSLNKKQRAYKVDSDYSTNQKNINKVNEVAMIDKTSGINIQNESNDEMQKNKTEHKKSIDNNKIDTQQSRIEHIDNTDEQKKNKELHNKIEKKDNTEIKKEVNNDDNKNVNAEAHTEQKVIHKINDIENMSKANNEVNKIKEHNSSEDKNITYTNHEWVDERISENRDDIADKDLDIGLSIGDKIDDDILLGYMEDGLTEEEKADLQEYLKVVLSKDEYDQLEVLFNRYNYMFNE